MDVPVSAAGTVRPVYSLHFPRYSTIMTKVRSLVFGLGIGLIVTVLPWGMIQLSRRHQTNLVRTQALMIRPQASRVPGTITSPAPPSDTLPQKYGGPSAEELAKVIQGVFVTPPPATP